MTIDDLPDFELPPIENFIDVLRGSKSSSDRLSPIRTDPIVQPQKRLNSYYKHCRKSDFDFEILNNQVLCKSYLDDRCQYLRYRIFRNSAPPCPYADELKRLNR